MSIMAYAGLKPAEQFIHTSISKLQKDNFSYGYLVSNQGEWFLSKDTNQPIKTQPPYLWQGKIGIGHTSPSSLLILCGQLLKHKDKNEPTVAVAYSGSVSNLSQVKNCLKPVYKFSTNSDAEIIGNYIDFLFRQKIQTNVPAEIAKTIRPLYDNIKGNFSFIVMSRHFPDHVVAMCRGQELVFTSFGHIASDINILSGFATKAFKMKDEDIVISGLGGGFIHPWRELEIGVESIPEISSENLHENSDDMLQDISEQVSLVDMEIKMPKIERPAKIYMFGSGSSYHAALAGQYYFESLSNVPTEVEQASEAQYRNLSSVQPPDTLFIAISQSGDNKDTLQVMRGLFTSQKPILLVHNNPNSMAVKISNYKIDIKAGEQKADTSTKTFTGQLRALLNQAANFCPIKLDASVLNTDIKLIDKVIKRREEVKSLAKDLSKYDHFLCLGRGINYAIALEAAFKFQEVCQLRAEGLPATSGLPIIDDKTACIFFCAQQQGYDVTLIKENMRQVKNKGGLVVSISDGSSWGWAQEFTDFSFQVPTSHWLVQPFIFNVVVQLLTYYTGIQRINDKYSWKMV